MSLVTYWLLCRKPSDPTYIPADVWYLSTNENFVFGQPSSVLNPKRAMKWLTKEGAEQAATFYGVDNWDVIEVKFDGSELVA